MKWAMPGSVTSPTTRSRPWQLGHSRTSMSKVRHFHDTEVYELSSDYLTVKNTTKIWPADTRESERVQRDEGGSAFVREDVDVGPSRPEDPRERRQSRRDGHARATGAEPGDERGTVSSPSRSTSWRRPTGPAIPFSTTATCVSPTPTRPPSASPTCSATVDDPAPGEHAAARAATAAGRSRAV
jgi:hypothetical protein